MLSEGEVGGGGGGGRKGGGIEGCNEENLFLASIRTGASDLEGGVSMRDGMSLGGGH